MFRNFLLLLTFFIALPSYAQSIPGADPLTLTVNPQYPRPYENFTVAPRSTLVDLFSSKVRITVNGSVVYEGSGTKGVTVRAGALGEQSVVVVTVTDPSGTVYTERHVITPSEVSLILEPVSTSHLLYQGGALVGSEGKVRLIALADLRSSNGTRLNPANLVYTWRLGDRILTDASGIGRSTLTATAPVRYRNADVSVTVTSPDSALVGEASTLISATDPIARIYKNDPLLGPNYDVALTNRFSMPDTEATFRAVGYFFSSQPTLSWLVNNSNGGDDKDITVRATGNGQGAASLSVNATDPKTRQSAGSQFTVDFGSTGGFGFFGL